MRVADGADAVGLRVVRDGARAARERRVDVEVVGVDVGRGAQAPREKEHVGIHPVDLDAVVRLRVLAQVRGGLAHLEREEVGLREAREVLARRPLRGRGAAPEKPDGAHVRRVLHRGRDPERDDEADRDRRETKERSAPARHARPLGEPGGEREPLQVHARRDRVKVVRKPLRLHDDARQRAHRHERHGDGGPRHLAEQDEREKDHRAGDREDGLRRAPRIREDVGRRARPEEAVQRRNVRELDAHERERVAVDREPREHDGGAERASESERDSSAFLARQDERVVRRERPELRDREEREGRLAEPWHEAERADDAEQTAWRRAPRSGRRGSSACGPCATSWSATLGSMNQSKKLSRCARSQ